MNFLKITTLVSLVTITLWFSLDFVVTKISGVRGFSQFFESDKIAGRINKPNFKGRFGGPLDEFSNILKAFPESIILF